MTEEMLIVGATRLAADELARGFCLEAGGAFGLHRFSPGALAVEIASERLASSGKAILAGIAVDALAARAVQDCRSREALQWFDPVATSPGFYRALAATIGELRLNDIGIEPLKKSGAAGADLAMLMASFERYLREAGLADAAEVYRTATEEVRAGRHRFKGMPLILVDVQPRSAVEKAFVQALGVPRPFQRNSVSGSGTALGRLREYMFSTATPPAGALDATLEFRSATDEARECVEIARAILDAQAPFDRMAILLRNPEAYQSLVEDALRRAKIPAYFTHGSRRPNPSGRALLTLLACAAEGLSATRFSEYLSLGQMPQEEETKTPPAWTPVQGELFPELPPDPPSAANQERPRPELRTPQYWERLLVDAAVIGGRDRWVRRLNGLQKEFEKQIQELAGEDEPRQARIERQLDRLHQLRRFAIPLIDFLGGLPRTGLWAEWLDALERLAAMALRQPEPVLATLGELRPMATVGPVTLDEVREVLTHRLTFLRREPSERRYGKVFVATIPEAAGLSFHTVFLPGLGEDLFPRRSFEDPLLLDVDRRPIGTDLRTQDVRVAEERLLFHTAARAAEEKLSISYPRMNAGLGRSRGPSFYAIEVMRAISGRVPDLRELQRLAGSSSQLSRRDAIDDTEYDIAVIRDLARTPVTDRRGGARYLLAANDNLRRSLQSRWFRWNARWSEADGIVDPDQATLDALKQHSLRKRPYSATALQQFAACPYRFLLYAIHRLQPRPEAAALQRIDPLTRGLLLHEIQFRILSRQAYADADAIFDETIAEYQDLLAPAISRVWETEVENLRWDVRGWLRQLTDSSGGWTPKWFEMPFNVTLLDGTLVRGAIDLVEQKDGRLRVTDHKTGKAQPRFGFTGNGAVLQPLLYAHAAEAALGKPAESTRLSYCTQRGGYSVDEISVTDEARRHFMRVLEAIEESLSQGFLPAAPRKDACSTCDYRIVCGPYEEIRLQKKKTDRLRLLEQLRAIP